MGVRFTHSNMAHYNTTIWMAILLVIIRLSSTIPTDNKKDTLKQKLLDVFEYGSSSAGSTDNKKDTLKQKLLDEFEYGSSSAGPTDNDEELSRNKLIEEKNYFQALNRGGFSSPQKYITEYDKLDTVRDTLFNIIKELDCNYTYDMLVFMKLMTPENYTNKKLYNKIDSACSNWAQQMLNTRINSGFPLKICPYTLWMFFLYTEKMKMLAKRDAKEKMNNLYGYIESHFTLQMKNCKYLGSESYKNVSYKKVLQSLAHDSLLEKIIGTCTHLNAIYETKLNINFDLFSSLYIKNVVEDTVIMNTLVTSFGGLDGRDKVVKILKQSIDTAKNPMSSLSDWIHSLGDVHNDFLRTLKTIMLRICYSFLYKNLKIKNSQSAEQVRRLLYKQHLKDFANFFQLNKDDNFVQLIQLYKEEKWNDRVEKMIFSISVEHEQRMSEIGRLLYKYDTEKSEFQFNNYDSKTLRNVNCQTSILENIANSIGYKVDVRSSIREQILCVEVFVEYLKKKLNGVNFNILKSFEEFDRMVRQHSVVC